jgi:hypothetical protein
MEGLGMESVGAMVEHMLQEPWRHGLDVKVRVGSMTSDFQDLPVTVLVTEIASQPSTIGLLQLQLCQCRMETVFLISELSTSDKDSF